MSFIWKDPETKGRLNLYPSKTFGKLTEITSHSMMILKAKSFQSNKGIWAVWAELSLHIVEKSTRWNKTLWIKSLKEYESCQMISWSILKVFKVFVSGFKLELEPDPQWHVSPELPPWVCFNYLLCCFVFATFFISIKRLNLICV